MTTIAEFTSHARFSASTESRIAAFVTELVCCGFSLRRVRITPEWRYRLCGITVAPSIPIAITRLSGLRRGTNAPSATARQSGCTSQTSNTYASPIIVTSPMMTHSTARYPNR